MPTETRPGGYKDGRLLKRARGGAADSLGSARRILDEVHRMRERTGRPDYSKLDRLLAQLMADLSAVDQSLVDMQEIRSGTARSTGIEQLEKRIAALEKWVEENG